MILMQNCQSDLRIVLHLPQKSPGSVGASLFVLDNINVNEGGSLQLAL